MLVKQIPIRNSLKNYMYLIACEKTFQTIAIDPLDSALCLKTAEDLGWSIKIVANTHHHHDHIGGNDKVIQATGAQLVAHTEAMEAIPNVDRGLDAVDKGTRDFWADKLLFSSLLFLSNCFLPSLARSLM